MVTNELDRLILFAEVKVASLQERLELAQSQDNKLDQLSIAHELCGALDILNESLRIRKQRHV